MSQVTEDDVKKSQHISSAKDEYLFLLLNLSTDPQFFRFKQMWDESESIFDFQQRLKEIKDWNNVKLEEVSTEILKEIDFSDSAFEDLTTAICLGYTMCLTSINLRTAPDDFNLRVPSKNTLIHSLLTNNAKKIFFHPEVFECRDCYRQFREMNREAIRETIISLLPLKDLIKYSVTQENPEGPQTLEADAPNASGGGGGESDEDYFPEKEGEEGAGAGEGDGEDGDGDDDEEGEGVGAGDGGGGSDDDDEEKVIKTSEE